MFPLAIQILVWEKELELQEQNPAYRRQALEACAPSSGAAGGREKPRRLQGWNRPAEPCDCA